MTISFRNLSKSFIHPDGRLSALENVSFDVQPHEFVSIVGPSGCGKTTLLKIIAGIIQPDNGEIIYGTPPKGNKLQAVLVFQDQGLLPWLNIRDNVGLGLTLQGIPKHEVHERALAYMEKVLIQGFENNYPYELSGGMKQRVALARAFLTDPEILLMDEPFGPLDAQTRLILQEELLHIWREQRKTVLFVTHDIEEAILLSDRILVMTDRPGKIQKDIRIPLERPRDLEDQDDPRIKEIKWQIWKMLEEEVRKELRLIPESQS